MLFNSYVFILFFLPITLVGYFFANRANGILSAVFPRIQNPGFLLGKIFLLGMSLWFYAYFTLPYLWIIVLSIVCNFAFSRLLLRTSAKSAKRLLLVFSLLLNLGVLFYFKYYNFFAENLNVLFHTDYTLRHLILPLGISFFTFQQISFLADTFRGEAPAYPFMDYALFVAYFPQLIAGPIMMHAELLPQFSDPQRKRFSFPAFSRGLYAFAFGMVKKVLLADAFANAVNWGYADISALGSIQALLVVLFYTLQIYFDFSGYCDMAVGLGLMFHIDIAQNFNSPYRALTITDFWSRWHITLTRFFRKYVYIPLGGNRHGAFRTHLNTMLVFLLSGLWHGANWTFVLWGALHGAFFILTKASSKAFARLHPALSWMITFLFVNITWVFFRADTLVQAGALFRQISLLNFAPLNASLAEPFFGPELRFFFSLLQRILPLQIFSDSRYVMLAFTLFAFWAVLAFHNGAERTGAFRPTLKTAFQTAFLLTWCILSLSGVSVFVYFNF